MYRKVLMILSKIFVFAHIKDEYFYNQALKESKRLKNVKEMYE